MRIILFAILIFSYESSALNMGHHQPDEYQRLISSYRVLFTDPETMLHRHHQDPSLAQRDIAQAIVNMRNNNININPDEIIEHALVILRNWYHLINQE